MEVRLPKLGEGSDSGSVVGVLVSVGEEIRKDQDILELENEKAVASVPSPAAGRVSKILVKMGDTVTVGQVVLELEASGASGSHGQTGTADQSETAPRQRTEAAQSTPGDHRYESRSGYPPPASPSIRKMAKQLGVDLTGVQGSGHGGRITTLDVQNYLRQLQRGASQGRQASIDFSQWGPIKAKKLTPLRRTIGRRMHESWSTIPHVTQFAEADITDLLALIKKYAHVYEKKKAHLTLTSVILKVAAGALKKLPIFNSSLDEEAEEVVYKEYIHIGVAVDTQAGLIVPVIRDVDKKSIFNLSEELPKLAEKTRQRKVSTKELTGGTFTVSNLGGIGGSYFTPIINHPEVAVLAVGRGSLKPVVKGKVVKPRHILPIGVSYDHRVVDGADGARFIREMAEKLEGFEETEIKI
jgi:pyruvate dehydrogenase E2 component (dihydrolipoamide acetyltransferase)